MEKFRSLIKGLKLPTRDDVVQAIGSFSKKERILFIFLFLVLSVSTLVLINKVNNQFLEDVPASGGSINEGIIGTPRFINPVLALTDADRDMTALVYSGLMRKNETGELVPDLAEKFTVSKDGLIYTFTLKDNFFQDNQKVTVDDIIYTINKIKHPTIKSPKKLNWEGVTVSKVDNKTVQFILKQAYASFLDNTTVGILPAHLWKDIPVDQFSFIDLNTTGAIGSGPYKITQIKKDSSGIPVYVELKAFNKFALGKPYIETLSMKFYANEKDLIDALSSGDIDQVSVIGPEKAEELKAKGYRVETATLPRIFALFFNQNQSAVFTDKNVVKAFETAINKDEIINKVLHGYGKTIDSPVPKTLIDYTGLPYLAKDSKSKDDAAPVTDNISLSKKILQDDGWKAGEDGVLVKQTKTKAGKKVILRLEFSLATGDASELKDIADLIKKDLESIGAKVEVKIFEIGSLNQDVIRPRKYDALLFGQIVNSGADLFAFWHSSQRNDPGLNIASYTNTKADKILEATLGNIDKKDRIEKYTEFEDEIKKDMPAIFIYSPDFIYVVAKNLNGLIINKITNQSDRFNLVYKWYRETDRVWKIFNR